MMFCRSKIVLCIPLVSKVTAFMGGCRYSIVFEVCCSTFVCVGLFGAFVGFWLGISCFRCQFMYYSSVVVCIWMCSRVSSGGAFR